MRTNRKLATAAAGLAAVLVTGGGVAVAASSTSGTIHGCVAKSGALSVAKTCPKGSKALTWNQTGPRGPRGVPGPAQAPAVYQATAENNGGMSENTLGKVVGIALPAGKYLVTWRIGVDTAASAGDYAVCQLETSNGTVTKLQSDEQTLAPTDSHDAITDLGGTVAVTLPQQISLEVDCQDSSGNVRYSDFSGQFIDAVPVSAIDSGV